MQLYILAMHSTICVCSLCISFTALECPALSPIPNGAISYGPDMIPDFYVDTVATHSCDPGFRLIGPQTRVCLLSTTWSDQPPACQRKFIVT